MSEFGSRLRAARKYAKLTQVQLARASGIRQSSLSEAERSAEGSAFTSQIAKSCGVDPHWLATGEGVMVATNTTSNVKFSMGDDQAPIVQALESLDRHLKELAPVLQDSGREVLRKWAMGIATTAEVADALEAMALASETMEKKKT